MTAEEFKNNILPFSRKLYPMLYRILKDEEETGDALQDLMVKLWNKKNELRNCSNQTAYIITMAKNHGLDLLKKKRPIRIGENEEHKILNLEASTTNPDTREKFENVQKVIENLPEKFREIIRYRDIDGFSFQEIKEMTGFEIPYLRVILSRARIKVKQEVEKIYDYDRTRKVTQKIL
jgi:RNA polymerase sigma-70 factor (ECF subfamily)